MKHADASTLERVRDFLDELRRRTALREPKPGTFYIKSTAFLHFHDDPSGIFCDVKLDRQSYSRFRVSTKAERKTLLKRIDAVLASLAS